MFDFIKSSLQKVDIAVTGKLQDLFGQSRIDAIALDQLSQILLEADLGVGTTKRPAGLLKAMQQSSSYKTSINRSGMYQIKFFK